MFVKKYNISPRVVFFFTTRNSKANNLERATVLFAFSWSNYRVLKMFKGYRKNHYTCCGSVEKTTKRDEYIEHPNSKLRSLTNHQICATSAINP
jgi:hypothetical protein